MCERVGRYALYWRLIRGKWLEEIDNPFTYTSLLSLLMYNGILGIKIENLAVSELLFCWLLCKGYQTWIYDEDGANGYLTQKFTLLLEYLLRHLR